MRRLAVVAVVLFLSGCVSTPSFTATTVIGGQDHVWDIAFAPDGTLLYTERAGRINALVSGQKRVLYTVPDVVTGGESGVLGMAVDPQFATNRRIYVCFASSNPPGAANDVRLARFVVNAGYTALTDRVAIVQGIPHAGLRHYGCRPRFGPDGFLYVGTGDAGVGTNPQDMASLGGKVLKVDTNGNPAPGNQFGRVFSYGHRNVQGIAFRTSDGLGVSTEHGPDRDDELNRLVPGNFGWDPVPGYNESVPMTDHAKFPSAVDARITSGSVTRAPSGATFVQGAQWGSWDGVLLVAMLKEQELISLALTSGGAVTDRGIALDEDYGRLRVVAQAPNGDLYVGTDNGGSDLIVKLAP